MRVNVGTLRPVTACLLAGLLVVGVAQPAAAARARSEVEVLAALHEQEHQLVEHEERHQIVFVRLVAIGGPQFRGGRHVEHALDGLVVVGSRGPVEPQRHERLRYVRDRREPAGCRLP